MAMNNFVLITGRISNDLEVKTTSQGTAVITFNVAVNRPYRKDKEAKADFIRCQAWKNTAEFIGKYFKKGDPISIQGSLHFDPYTDKDGNKKIATQVLVEQAGFCLGGKKNTDASEPFNQPAPSYASADNSDFEEIIDDDDDLPF